jgi:hypothetical protein
MGRCARNSTQLISFNERRGIKMTMRGQAWLEAGRRWGGGGNSQVRAWRPFCSGSLLCRRATLVFFRGGMLNRNSVLFASVRGALMSHSVAATDAFTDPL